MSLKACLNGVFAFADSSGSESARLPQALKGYCSGEGKLFIRVADYVLP